MTTKKAQRVRPSDLFRERPAIQEIAMYIAIVVRNDMENFHVAHLSDAQMAELNPIIRNAIYTALHVLKFYDKDAAAKAFADSANRNIPDYWEPPQITDDFKELVKFLRDKGRY